jgi:hypothetical protein
MGTALAVRDTTTTLDHRDRAAVTSGMSFEQIVGMGDQLVRTGFLPNHVKTGAQAAAIVLAGQELGMPPMRALRSLVLVQGKVVENADSQLSRFKADGGRAIWKRLDEQGATLWLRHPNGDEHEESFTWEDAGRAKLTAKDTWKAYPKAMLRSRVITAGLKSIGWEGGVGNYDPDEAAAFSAPTPLSGGGPTNGTTGTDEDVVDEVMTIETALAMPLPGAPTAWQGNGGKPLGELSAKMIPAIRKWINGKIEEAGDQASPLNYRLRNACDLILEMRKGATPQKDLELEPKASIAPAAAAPAINPTELQPGKIEDAIDKPAPAMPPTTEIMKKLNALFKDEKFTTGDGPEQLRAFKDRRDKCETADDLKLVLHDVDTYVALPF